VRRMLVAVALAALLAPVATASAHQGNPNFRSAVRAVTPATQGLSVQVLNLDDRFELINRTGRTVEIGGYNNDIYARVRADGTVQVNKRSPAYYLNQDRDDTADVPDSADPKAPPQWETLDKTGRFQWHDHRMHWMGKGVPPQVKDTSRRTKVYDYEVPIKVGGQPGAIEGTLTWVPDDAGGAPTGAIVGFVVIVVLGVGAVLVVRRRRSTGGGEAW
jgi:hypothetical protein